ncbi:hypothetical protein HKX48_004121 [Thoreauomyces humboldtii]|nr:hypothetical protein HKX48_004121 [Thoreauomyces humboldtii]
MTNGAYGSVGDDTTPPSSVVDSTTINVDEETALLEDGQNKGMTHGHGIGHKHYSDRTPWLRAAVLGANDGLVSVASLIVGFAGSSDDHRLMVLSGVAALVAGALSMACGEYVSVATQKDTEAADMAREKEEFMKGPQAMQRELLELAGIYEARGISPALALQVAEELHAAADGDIDEIVKVHLREELNVDVDELANPLQAAVTSACCFSVGALLPLLAAIFITNYDVRLAVVIVVTTIGLVINGMLGSFLGGANMWKGAMRVLIGGWLAMIGTYGVGKAFNVSAA